MSIKIIRKAFGLLIADIVIIIGIFVLQFRTDSSFIEKIGNLQFTFSKIEDNEQNVSIQNKFRLSYNGLNLYHDEKTPAIIKNNKSETLPLTFLGWEKTEPLSCTLNFSDDVKVTFELDSDSPSASLKIIADLPSSAKDIALPYNYSSSMRIQKDDGNRVVLNGRKASWEVSAFSLDSGYFTLSENNYVASYSVYDETQKFSFDSIINLAIAEKGLYLQTVQNFKDNLIASYKANTSESNISEQVIVSYIASQIEKNNYQAALDEIPANLKKSRQRTYLSAPYLDTLSEMNQALEASLADYESKITDAANSSSLDIFTVHNISNFMAVHSRAEDVVKLLQNAAASDIASSSLVQATGILEVYVDLVSLNPDYARCLLPIIPDCIERITRACSFENNMLTISENDTFLSVVQAVETGIALLRYGILSDDVTLQKAGYAVVNSYMSDSSSYDLRTLANLYPVIAYDNKYYPHFEKIRTNDSSDLWAWTCANSITYEKDSDGSITLTVDFPENWTHYIIVKGIPQFSSIYIYNMAFRTDPRFETYNSSGYVYKAESKTLLLKSRHKERFETIRMEYRARPAASTTPKPSSESSTASSSTESSGSGTEVVDTAAQNVLENAQIQLEYSAAVKEDVNQAAGVQAAAEENAADQSPSQPAVENQAENGSETPSETSENAPKASRRRSWRSKN